MALRSFGHSIRVTRRDLPVTTVTGPLASLMFCFDQCLTSERISLRADARVGASARYRALGERQGRARAALTS